ncbi:alpha-N-arabinofuranosidase [Massilia sp. IC2-477]|uniref:alpha-N-arabinofuranosidase n=1 Tax=Massilia sp. IC2-477 TaxID=2887198 RepID=UPI001D122761|nr:alpha-L-arabinofuranosidase C-terminal domain-containing protein [Massilia sp. IC2-477]MCC2954145.1 alpha-N-arabinofuranosidase [Massilia sp. IC2-477]
MKRFRSCILALGMLAAPAWAQLSVTVDTTRPGAAIHKDVYGQFAEHLGSGVYGGMWVGSSSKIPNVRGWRKDVVGALRDLHVPLVRWPGGCFADEYHWREGIGPRERRPVRVNTNWGGVEESNAVGTHEFFDLVEQIGADAYVNGNLGSGSVQEMSEWLEYMTSDSKSSLAQLRRKNGRDKPFKLAYFAVGNEAWGCGGQMRPEHYTNLYRNTAAFLKAPPHLKPGIIASGGTSNGEDTKWTDLLSKDAPEGTVGISFHHYTLPTGDWKRKGAATGFPEEEWISTLARTLEMENYIKRNVAVLDRNDPQKKIGLFVDEWGTWYDVEEGSNPGFLYQQNTLRDAVVAALNFNLFHAHAERVRMTNIAQMVNVLQAMILTDKDRMLLTPTYHAFRMYVPFQGAVSLAATVERDQPYVLGATSVPGLSVSAARARDGKVHVAMVNPHPREARQVDLQVIGQQASRAVGQVLTAEAMDAHNSFRQPQAVTPQPYRASASEGKLRLTLPAKSVLVVALEP